MMNDKILAKDKILYLDASCGISGDMAVGALLELGGNEEKLRAAIESLGLEDCHVHVKKSSSYSIAGTRFEVHVHGHSADETPSREEGYAEHAEGYHHHEHRHLSEVLEIIDRGNLTENARRIAHRIFEIIAEAEAKAHGVEKSQAHFHEVGAVDSIVDIVSVAVLADDLGVARCVVTGLCEGSGFVMTQHGKLPVPVPAVSRIAEAFGIALHRTGTQGEMVTPTGIAIVAALRTQEELPSNYKILKSGTGLGKRDFGRANFLSAEFIEEVREQGNSPNDLNVYILECSIDDSSPEELGLAMDKILEDGARDVHFIPCQMKKNRPGVLLRAIVDGENLPKVERSIFRNTTTIGLRRIPVVRNCMERSFAEVETPFGNVTVKKCEMGEVVKYKPEFESVRAAAEKSRVPFRDVFDAARSNAKF